MNPSKRSTRALRLAPAVVGPGSRMALSEGWEFASTPPDRCATPAELVDAELAWRAAVVPGTVAAALRAAGAWDAEAPPELDGRDHWFRVRVRAARAADRRTVLRFERLATFAEAWLNGAPILRSESMFVSNAVDVSELVEDENELVLCFRALAPRLARRRPRPRWLLPMVAHRNLRYVRTSLLGHMPGWSGAGAAIGPAGPVELLVQQGFGLEQLQLRSRLEGQGGVTRVEAVVDAFGGDPVSAAALRVGDQSAPLEVERLEPGRFRLRGELALASVEPWWPHTHGEPRLYSAELSICCGEETSLVELPRVGFRSIRVDERGGGFTLELNGTPIFARGACWIPLDALRAWCTEEELVPALAQCVAAGMNMLRITGATDYAPEAFHSLCDKLGILVFQDFMLANFDYPEDDPDFVAALDQEADELLERLGSHSSLTVLCGGSETAQQPAMMGLPREVWDPPPLAARLGARCRDSLPEVPFVPASPFGGALPFRVDHGLAHYFGVGAYERPLSDARTAGVRFASACLAFSQVPEPEGFAHFGASAAGVHHPRYRAAVPRDAGASWDFADVTDTYLARCFDVDPPQLRRSDPERYFELCRATLVELFSDCIGIFRRAESPCAGALVWTLRDLTPGAGWGLVDASGAPKPAWFALARACAPRAAWFADEGLNGLRLHLANDRPEPIAGVVRVRCVRPDGKTSLEVEHAVELGAHESWSEDVEALLGLFVDVSRAYRFGPPEALAVVARWTDGAGAFVADAVSLDPARVARESSPPALQARATPLPDGRFAVELSCERLAQTVVVRAPGFSADDAYFHLAPGLPRTILLSPSEPGLPLRGRALALNTATGVPLELAPDPEGA